MPHILSAIRGDWRPGIPPWIALAIQITLGAQVFSRGTDYAFGDRPELVRSLGAVERAAPLWVWGSLFVVSTVILFGGMIVRQVSAVILGHALAAGCYTAIAYGVLEYNVDRYGWGDGYRTTTGLLCAAVLSALLALATRLQYVKFSTKERVRHEHGELVT